MENLDEEVVGGKRSVFTRPLTKYRCADRGRGVVIPGYDAKIQRLLVRVWSTAGLLNPRKSEIRQTGFFAPRSDQ